MPPRLKRSQRHVKEQAPGAVYVRDLTLWPSPLWSPEFRAFYAKATENDWVSWSVPPKTASKEEWDRFDAWLDEHCNAVPLAAARRRYPVNVAYQSIAGVSAAVITPRTAISAEDRHRVLINLHGGAFVFNRGLCGGELEAIPVAAIGGIKVITLDYRQAPFHRYPAATEDVKAVYTELLKQFRPESIGIFGCSAGGVLTAQAVAHFRSAGLPAPGAIGIFNMAPPPPYSVTLPWDPAWGDSRIWSSCPPVDEPSEAERRMAEVAYWYMEGARLNDSEAYPGSSDDVLASFPPTLLLAGTRDYAASTVIAAHARLLKLGVDSSLYLMEGGPHAAHVVAVETPEAHDAQAYIVRWFGERLAR